MGIPWGFVGVAWAYTIGSIVFLLYPTFRSAGRIIDLRFVGLLRNLAGPFACAIGMGGVLWICDRLLLGHFAPLVRVAFGLPVGVFTYVLLIQRSRLEAWREFRVAVGELSEARLPTFRRTLKGRLDT